MKNSKFKQLYYKYKKQLTFYLVLNIIVAVFITFSSYSHIPLSDYKDHLIYFIHFLLIQFSFFGFLYFLSLNKYIFYTLFPIIFIILALLSFYIYTQDIVISKYLIEAIAQTSLLVSLDLISINLVILITSLFFLLRFIFKKYNEIDVNQLQSPLLIFAILGMLTFPIIEKLRPNTFKSRMPYVAYYSILDYLKANDLTLLPVNKNIKATKEDIEFIFILGEAVRADHLQLNGYNRVTNPLLSKRKNIISFPFLHTKFTHTVPSVKQLLTNKSVNDGDNYKEVISLFSVLNQAKFNTFWIANSTLVSSYEPIIRSNNHLILIDKFRSIMSFNKALDEKMLQPFDSVLKTNNHRFISLHMTGSHWWYENRYPKIFRKYKPVIKSKYIPSLKPQEIINSYDNTLVYLDYFIDQVIKKIEKRKTKAIILYVADHGELLGENGKWLHAQNTKYSKNPAMIVWYSDALKAAHPDLINNLKENSKHYLTTDFFYHSILDLYDFKNIDYDVSQSIFRKK